MQVKICGMKYADNVVSITSLQPDFMGFIFYDKSKRFVGELEISILQQIPQNINKVAVFVNETIDKIKAIVTKYELNYIQLHGNETVDFCEKLKEINIPIIKAFNISDDFDFTILEKYQNSCSYFLFDTFSKNYGGSGKTFNWKFLEKYQLTTKFFLSGGIGLENIHLALSIQHPQLFALDINSKAEVFPALKNISYTNNIIKIIKEHESI